MLESDIDEDLQNANFLKQAKPGSQFTFIHNKDVWPTSVAQRLASLLKVPACCVGHYVIMYAHVERKDVEDAFLKIEPQYKNTLYSLIKITVPSRGAELKIL